MVTVNRNVPYIEIILKIYVNSEAKIKFLTNCSVKFFAIRWREHGVKWVVSVQEVFRLNLEINSILFWGFNDCTKTDMGFICFFFFFFF